LYSLAFLEEHNGAWWLLWEGGMYTTFSDISEDHRWCLGHAAQGSEEFQGR